MDLTQHLDCAFLLIFISVSSLLEFCGVLDRNTRSVTTIPLYASKTWIVWLAGDLLTLDSPARLRRLSWEQSVVTQARATPWLHIGVPGYVLRSGRHHQIFFRRSRLPVQNCVIVALYPFGPSVRMSLRPSCVPSAGQFNRLVYITIIVAACILYTHSIICKHASSLRELNAIFTWYGI
jgi:hypothetical protein